MFSFSTRLESKIGDTDFTNPTLTNLVNLALTVGVVIPVSREISRNDLRPSLSNDLRLDDFHNNYDRYGLVISDLRMPVMNGYQFIKKVKEIKPQVKVLFILAFEINEIEFRTELPFIKVDEFIKKPISLDDFISTVSKHINN